jgi:uncharacterized secreted protein with C-terminal beta-propeller domain
MFVMKNKMVAAFIIVSLVAVGAFGILALQGNGPSRNDPNPYYVSYTNLEKFNNFQEPQDFIVYNSEQNYYYYYYSNISVKSGGEVYFSNSRLAEGAADTDSDFSPTTTDDHSTTNVQVEGVDEGDIVKNDGKYAYIVSRNKTKVYIIDVYPAEEARILSIIVVNFTIIEIYITEDKLVICGSDSQYYGYYTNWYYDAYESIVHISIYNMDDRENTQLEESHELAGDYKSSRMIGDYLYIIASQPSSQIETESDLPVPVKDVYYTDDYDDYYTFTTIMSINVKITEEEPNMQVILVGWSTHIYVSRSNIYLTYYTRMSWLERMERKVDEVFIPTLPSSTVIEIFQVRDSDISRSDKLHEIDMIIGEYEDGLSYYEKNDVQNEWLEREEEYEEDIQEEIEKTMIHRIYINGGEIYYEASGGVPGYVLNRFSMDEYKDHFRIATTTGQVWRSGNGGANNHVYVLNMDLEITGGIQDIAPGESIYSARFMGKRAYLVTFKKVDPFFVIDLSDPENPAILGELKIPGYSNYLHPYDENHVIGIGKDAYDMDDFAWYQGVKISLFDVSDVYNPEEISQFIIGDRGTESLALSDPHAFLFSRDKNLLVIPVVLAEIDESKYPDGASPSTHGDYTFCGAYVFDISIKDGIDYHGRITHTDEPIQSEYYWYYDSTSRVKRSFYIKDVLYTVSGGLIQANNLNDLEEITEIELD